MSRSERCTLLLMRDDGRIMRCRVSFRFFRVLCVVLALMFPLAGGLCLLVRELYQANQDLDARFLRMEQENLSLAAQVQRLSNLEQVLEMPAAAVRLALQSRQAKNRAAAVQDAAATPAQESPPPGEQKDAGQVPEAAATTTEPSPSSFPPVDMGLIGVENVHIRSMSGDKLRISLDLQNAQQRGQLAGHVACSAKSKNEIYPLEISKENAAFRINRFKRALFIPQLPVAVRNADFTVIVEIHFEERGLVYRNEFPVER
jgi:hypothetical protein